MAPLTTLSSASAPAINSKLQQLALLAGLALGQFTKSSQERALDALSQPASESQVLDAQLLANRLEESLPAHAGTALRTRAALCLVLLDPPGSVRLGQSLGFARRVLG